MERTIGTKLNTCKVVTFGLDAEQHKAVCEMIQQGKRDKGNLSLERVDTAMVKYWVENAIEEKHLQYAQFLTDAIKYGREIYTLDDSLGLYKQTLGDVVVMND